MNLIIEDIEETFLQKIQRLFAEVCKEYRNKIGNNIREEDIQIDVEKGKNPIILGRCYKTRDSIREWRIVIYEFDYRTDDGYKETIMHEIVHTFPGCFNHGPRFKRYESLIKYYLGYSIRDVRGETHADSEAVHSAITNQRKEKAKYILYCPKCNTILKHITRRCTATVHPEYYRHSTCSTPTKCCLADEAENLHLE